MFQLPVVDPGIPCALVPQASRRRGALLARTLLRTGIVDAALMPARPGPDHLRNCQTVLEGWVRRELGALRMLRPYFAMNLREAGSDAGHAVGPSCTIEWGGESFGVRCVGPALEFLERHQPRLGRTVLQVLERQAFRTLPIYTPAIVMECASDVYWYGESDEDMALEEACGDDADERKAMRDNMVTRAMFDSTFPGWALGGRSRPVGRRTLQHIAESASDRRVANVIESLISVLGVDLPNYDWSFREGRFVGFSGVLAWGREDELTTRVLDDYE
ncbi:MAG TPA: PRTRC system protein F, partial [Burkholderiaceae bacterium]|nr:PRTRC system protein F [Burkholderiaceae bacterium]